jgi:hypothetical protein
MRFSWWMSQKYIHVFITLNTYCFYTTEVITQWRVTLHYTYVASLAKLHTLNINLYFYSYNFSICFYTTAWDAGRLTDILTLLTWALLQIYLLL